MVLAAVIPLSGCREQKMQNAARSSGPLDQRAYIWQRDWNAAVRRAIDQHGQEFAGLAVLGAQLEWPEIKAGGAPGARVVRPRIDWHLLEGIGRPIAAVIRVERPGPNTGSHALGNAVAAEARRLISAAGEAGALLAEVQVDYDSPQKRLAEYTSWLNQVERALEPLRVRITTLASWLAEPEFRALIAACDGYVLQVHSFDPPAPGHRPTVCDPAKAWAWAEQAAALGRPFTIALPTYRTTAGYDAGGKLVGVATDSVSKEWPPGTVRQEFPSDPAALAGLVAQWMEDRPALLEGIYWYRLPVSSDSRNWRWPALAAVMSGLAPLSRLEVKMSGGQPLDVVLSNSGEQDEWLPQTVTLSWSGPAPAAGDGVAGWTFSSAAGRAVFTSPGTPAARLLPSGQSTALGWLRFYEPAPPIPSLHTAVDPPRPPAPRDW